MKWSNDEIEIISQYRRTMKSVRNICYDLDNAGFMRTYKSVTRKIESMGWTRPTDVSDLTVLPKILMFDIETTPMPVWVWDFGKQYVPPTNLMRDDAGHQKFWYILSWSAKWLYDEVVLSDVLTPKEAVAGDDSRILKSIWELLDEADIVVAHNGDRFDIRKLNARFILNDMLPPAPYKSIDTLKIARKEFAFSSNKQDFLTKYFGLAEKLNTEFQLWIDCMNGDKARLQEMLEYNKRDVVGLEQVYLKLRPYIRNHPNLGVLMDDDVCPTCGSESLSPILATYFTSANEFPVYRCGGCGSPFIRSKTNMNVNGTELRSIAR
jgi:DNA polymerase elongation subunit (family B)|tara:strand:+ start:11025 stop:11990 length:966 start_codon:yes stop_codon:yes gene_type:complete